MSRVFTMIVAPLTGFGVLGLGLAAPAIAQQPTPASDEPIVLDAAAQMTDAEGIEVGTVTFRDHPSGTHVSVDLVDVDMDADYRGFHLHETAQCDPDDPEGAFMSAGGHWNPDDAEDHSDHPGDMLPQLILGDQTAQSEFVTDRFGVEEILDAELAVILHADRDNFGHVPDRYTSDEAEESGPDEETLETGDAGDRHACGVVEAGDASAYPVPQGGVEAGGGGTASSGDGSAQAGSVSAWLTGALVFTMFGVIGLAFSRRRNR